MPFKDWCKWFATKSEAEEFAKTLIQPVKEKVKTPQLDLNEWLDKYKKLNLAVNDLANAIELANFDKVFLKLDGTNSKEKANILYDLWNPKQPLKQVVHCKTQDEWDFVSNKIGYKFTTKFELRNSDTINIAQLACDCKSFYERRGEYKLLSFQEWCDLNGYKMENEVKFEVGKLYSFNWDWKGKNCIIISKIKEVDSISISVSWRYDVWNNSNCSTCGTFLFNDISDIKELSIEEIQQYLPDGHPDKIKSNQEFKVGEYIFVMIKGKNFGDILKVTDSFIEKKI